MGIQSVEATKNPAKVLSVEKIRECAFASHEAQRARL